MQVSSISAASRLADLGAGSSSAGKQLQAADDVAAAGQDASNPKLREKFDTFVGEAFYGQMLAAMRKTVGKAAYFDGGRAEEIFRGQLDQVIAQRLTESNANSFTGPMYDLFALGRR